LWVEARQSRRTASTRAMARTELMAMPAMAAVDKAGFGAGGSEPVADGLGAVVFRTEVGVIGGVVDDGVVVPT
jgi:hypothetical protein